MVYKHRLQLILFYELQRQGILHAVIAKSRLVLIWTHTKQVVLEWGALNRVSTTGLLQPKAEPHRASHTNFYRNGTPSTYLEQNLYPLLYLSYNQKTLSYTNFYWHGNTFTYTEQKKLPLSNTSKITKSLFVPWVIVTLALQVLPKISVCSSFKLIFNLIASGSLVFSLFLQPLNFEILKLSPFSYYEGKKGTLSRRGIPRTFHFMECLPVKTNGFLVVRFYLVSIARHWPEKEHALTLTSGRKAGPQWAQGKKSLDFITLSIESWKLETVLRKILAWR